MSEPDPSSHADLQAARAAWSEARELVARLEGSSVRRLAVAAGDVRIEVERDPAMVPAAGVPAAGTGAAAPPAGDGRQRVVAPLVGTFYRASQPGSPPLVEVGDVIEAGTTVGIVEAMKLMNDVTVPQGGRVAEIVVENAQFVEFGQVLMYLEAPDE